MEEKTFNQWAILELMGKVRLAGLVREEQVFGVAMLRLDIPDGNGETKLTRYFHPNALYGLTPVSKEVAIAVASYNETPPARSWELKSLQPAAAVDATFEEFEED